MKYSIEFTDTAKSDIRDIAFYIAEESKNKEIAKKFINELAGTCLRLEAFPLSGALPKDRTLKALGYRFLIHKEYLIFYSVNASHKKVYINAVFNAKKDYTRVLKKLI